MADAREGYAPILDRLLPLYSARGAGGHPIILRDGYHQVPHLAHGWFMRCQRAVEAVLILDEAGYAEEAAGIRRSVIEHVLALKWLASEGDAVVDTIARGHAEGTKRRLAALTGAGWTSFDPDDFAAAIASADADARDRHNDHLLQFSSRLAAYGDVNTLPDYIATCSRVHPSYDSAMAYIAHAGGALTSSHDAVWQVPFCTTAMLESLICLQHILEPKPWVDELATAEVEFKTVTNEVRVQDGLQPVDWANLGQEHADDPPPNSDAGTDRD